LSRECCSAYSHRRRRRDGAPLDAAVASKEQQISALKSDISEAECDYAVDEPIIEDCEILDAQAQALAAEIETLKTQADQSAAKAPAPRAARPYSYAAHTKPNISYRTFCEVNATASPRCPPPSFPMKQGVSRAARQRRSCSTAPLAAIMRARWFY
jgi:hypothetical protein